MIAHTRLHRRAVDEVAHAIKWQTASRYMQVEAFTQINAADADPILSTTTKAA